MRRSLPPNQAVEAGSPTEAPVLPLQNSGCWSPMSRRSVARPSLRIPSIPGEVMKRIVLQNKWIIGTVALLLVVLEAQLLFSVRQNSQTFDESAHIYSGYSYWKTGDFGINPEHPP